MNSKTLGLRLRQAREHLGISQEDLAAAISKDQKAISEYENGKRKLAVTDLPAFATLLQVPISYFFEEDNNPQELDEAILMYFHEFSLQDDKQAILDIMRILSEIVRRNRVIQNK